MTQPSKVQLRVTTVLERLRAMALENKDDAVALADHLDVMLNTMHGDDAFGTEGQCDPRGDFRNNRWSMTKVEGVDR